MKKSTIWLLTTVMACTFIGLLYVQIMYMENMIKMRNEQFSEIVVRSLHGVSSSLERDETRYFLEKNMDDLGMGTYPGVLSTTPKVGNLSESANKGVTDKKTIGTSINLNGRGDIAGSYKTMQENLKGLYLYQKGLLNEVVLEILNQSSGRPIQERADSTIVRTYLKTELENNGLDLPFEFAVVNRGGAVIYKTKDFVDNPRQTFSQTLFPNDPVSRMNSLKVSFPTKGDYIFSSIKFMVPSFVFSFILLVVSLYTIILAFRQKKLTEMKNDFINNMTHEFKTPVSSISLAAQMLKDESVRKSPAMIQNISNVINDETKRLRFQVEKVLQMSMFDREKASLKLQEVDCNALIANVVNTHKLKVEKYGGSIEANLDAEDSILNVDEMHFTNVIFNLLDNAVKYRREDVPLTLKVGTRNLSEDEMEITISDNGIGIKKEDLKKIFEKFYRVSTGNRHDVKGFGLGLAYVHKMIKELGGDIRVESDFGHGSTFIITMPLIK